MGAKAARQMKTAKIIERRKSKAIEDKTKLLKNLEVVKNLQIVPLIHNANNLVFASNLTCYFGNNRLFEHLSFSINQSERVLIKGKNGSGKSTLLKLLTSQYISYEGELKLASNMKISYVPQDTSFLKGALKEYIFKERINETLFKSILSKLDFTKLDFEKRMEDYSAGQKKKVLIAKSLCEEAHLYIWDEPLNYIDIISRIQIENLILKFTPTLIFVEHDKAFSEKILTKVIYL